MVMVLIRKCEVARSTCLKGKHNFFTGTNLNFCYYSLSRYFSALVNSNPKTKNPKLATGRLLDFCRLVLLIPSCMSIAVCGSFKIYGDKPDLSRQLPEKTGSQFADRTRTGLRFILRHLSEVNISFSKWIFKCWMSATVFGMSTRTGPKMLFLKTSFLGVKGVLKPVCNFCGRPVESRDEKYHR